MFYYRIYGLVIRSEIELPEAYETQERTEDVEIKYGVMPPYIKRKQEAHYATSILHRKYKWFYFENEGNFLMEEGKSITLEPDAAADEKHIRAIILGACLGSILYQRELVSIHGSAVVWKDKAVIVSGTSGAGKSTVSSEFRKRGGLFMADDTVAVTIEEGIVYANPSYPQQKLCRDAAIRLGYDLNRLVLLQEECTKYAVGLKASFCPVKKEVAALLCLDIDKEGELIMKEVNGSEKLEAVISNLYTYSDCVNAGMGTGLFRKCLEMARKVPVIKAVRPLDGDSCAQIVEYAADLLENKLFIQGA
jgi:hypothetical protein